MIRSTAPDQFLIDTQSISGDCFTYHFRRDQKAEVSWRIVDQWHAGLLIKSEADALLLAVYDVTLERRSIASRLRRAVSRMIDRWCERVFPCSGTGNRSGK